jgi:hypothetical protein
MNDELVAIATRLGFDTLETRNSDRLDFRAVAVWQIVEALEAAYDAGKRATTEKDLMNYTIQRQDDGRYLTAQYLRWSSAAEEAERCDPEEAQTIRGWLKTIGIPVAVTKSW